MSEIYKPASEPPPPNPDPKKASPPIPIALWQDCEIRRAMEHSVLNNEESTVASTKEIHERGLLLLLGISIALPLEKPSDSLPDTNNDLLSMFAYTAYDVLADYFQKADWHDWYIAPYFNEGDDMNRSFNLGVFIDENFNQTVVE